MSARRAAARRRALAVAAVVGLAGCHYDFDKSTIEQRGVSGVAQLDDGSFAFAIFPCEDDLISRIELVVEGLGAGTDYIRFTTVLRAEFDPPLPARELLISTSPMYEPPAGATVEILDAEALDRFNNDRGYLTSDSIDQFFAIDAWDANGVSLPVGSSLHSRFAPKAGQIVLTDSYVGDIDEIRCQTESTPAWHRGST
ncbi:MAG: hypothetical protein ABMA25_12390 [Ilumatobacteraceae bacterium]